MADLDPELDPELGQDELLRGLPPEDRAAVDRWSEPNNRGRFSMCEFSLPTGRKDPYGAWRSSVALLWELISGVGGRRRSFWHSFVE